MVRHLFTCLFMCHNGMTLAMILLPQQIRHTTMRSQYTDTEVLYLQEHLCYFGNAYVEISEVTKK